MTATTLTPTPRTVVPDSIPAHRSPADTARDILVMAKRGLIKIRRNPEQLFDVVFQPILFTVMFAYLFGGAIAGDTATYLTMLIPGIVVQSVLTGASGAGSTLREDMDKGVYDRFRSLPIARVAPLAGALVADVVRYLIAGSVTFIVGYVMGYRPGGGLVGSLAAILLVAVCAWAVSWIFALVGTTVKSARGVQSITMMVFFPLTFLSNIFVPVDTLPGWLQGFVNVNPISHLVTGARSLANTATFDTNAWIALAGSAVIVAVFAPLTVRAYTRLD